MTNTTVDYSRETSYPVAKVLSRVEGVKRLSAGYYEAICPTGECREKRLLVIEGVDDRALVECDEGCWLHQIVSALGLTADDLFKCIDDIYIGSKAPKYDKPEDLQAG